MSVQWKAPYPPPDVLNQYKHADKDEIFKAVREERKHRHKQEAKMFNARIANSAKAVDYTFILLGCGILFGTILILNDKDALGITTILGTSILPLGSKIVSMVKDWGHVHRDAAEESDNQVVGEEDKQKTLPETG